MTQIVFVIEKEFLILLDCDFVRLKNQSMREKMTEETAVLRAAIFVSILGYIILIAFPGYFTYFYGVEYFDIYLQHGFSSKITLSAPLAYSIILLYISSKIMVFFFWRFSREVFISFLAVNVIITSLSGMSVATPIEATIGYMVVILDGAILSALYFSPVVRKRFELKR